MPNFEPKRKNGYTRGKFRPRNPHKYNGDVNNVVFRSSYELKAFKRLDERDEVLKWSSEEYVIPYIDPMDQKTHRYFIDLWFRVRTYDGTIVEKLIEIKPACKLRLPKKQQRITRRYLKEVAEYNKNEAKWKAAIKFARRNGMEFQVWTEKQLGIHK